MLKFLSYKLQYSGMQNVWGKRIAVNGDFFMRIYGRIVLGDNLVFHNATRYNSVGINRKCSIFVEKSAQLSIGHNNGFSGVSIVCYNGIEIGNNCKFGGNVAIWDTDFHPINYKDRRVDLEEAIISKTIKIGNDVFIGANSMVLKGVKIGNRAVIGAGSVVASNIPEDEVWAGNPAKFIKDLK